MAPDRIDIIGIALCVIEHVLAEAYNTPIEPSDGVRLALAVLVEKNVAQIWQVREFWSRLREHDEKIVGQTAGYTRKSYMNSMVPPGIAPPSARSPAWSSGLRCAMRIDEQPILFPTKFLGEFCVRIAQKAGLFFQCSQYAAGINGRNLPLCCASCALTS